MAVVVTVAFQSKTELTRLRADHDKRQFVICPKCKSDEINYIAVRETVSMFKGKNRIKQVTRTRKDKGLTLCRKCLHCEGKL